MTDVLTEKIFNPKSNKHLKINSPGFKKLLKDDKYTFENGVLVPPDRSNFAFSTVQNHWISKDSTLYKKNIKNYDVIDSTLMPKDDGTVMGINKRRISRQAAAYRKLLAIGYTYDDERKALIYPLKVEHITHDSKNMPTGFCLKLRSLKYSHMIIQVGDNQYNIAIGERPMRNIREDWYKKTSAMYTGNDDIVSQIDLYESVPRVVTFGPSFEGDPNCFISRLESHFKQYNYPTSDFEKLYKEYEDGVFESDIENISKKLKLKITVFAGRKDIVYGEKRNMRSQAKLHYFNNHIQATVVENKDKEVVFIENLSISSLCEQGVDINDITNVIGGVSVINDKETKVTYMVSTDAINYRLKNDRMIDLEENDCFTATSYYLKQLIATNPLMKNIVSNHDNLDAIHTIAQNGVMFCNQRSGGKCIDLKGAYSNYINFTSYTGLPSDLSSCVETKEMKYSTILKIITECEGFALIDCFSVFDKWSDAELIKDPESIVFSKPIMDYESDDEDLTPLEIEKNKKIQATILSMKERSDQKAAIEAAKTRVKSKRWVSFPYLRHRLALDVAKDIHISYLMIATNRIDLNVEAFSNASKREFHKALGKMISHRGSDGFTTTDPVVANNYMGAMIYENKEQDKQLFACSVPCERLGFNYHPHITSYIQQYTEIEIEKKYLEIRRKNILVYRIWVDGIVIPSNADIKIDSSMWHIKNCDGLDYVLPLKYVVGVPPIRHNNIFNNTLTNLYHRIWPPVCSNDEEKAIQPHRYCIVGSAGTGKSYNLRELFKQMNNSIILVFSNKLKRNYAGLKVRTIQKFLARFDSSYETILIDEYSMIGQDLIDSIRFIDTKRIVLVGDMGQLKCVGGEPINTLPYTKITLTHNYRQEDDVEFFKKLELTRKTHDVSWIQQTISIEDAIKQKFTILCITNDEIKRVNKIGHALNPNPEICELKVGTPIRFRKTAHKKKTSVLYCYERDDEDDSEYVAGDVGIIFSIDTNECVTIIKYIKTDKNNNDIHMEKNVHLDNKLVLNKNQITFAYGETIHSAQGTTIKDGNILINIGEDRIFDDQLTYVAASRAVKENQLYLTCV